MYRDVGDSISGDDDDDRFDRRDESGDYAENLSQEITTARRESAPRSSCVFRDAKTLFTVLSTLSRAHAYAYASATLHGNTGAVRLASLEIRDPIDTPHERNPCAFNAALAFRLEHVRTSHKRHRFFRKIDVL